MDKGLNFTKLIPVFLIVAGIFLMNVPVALKETSYVDMSSEEVQEQIERIEKIAETDQGRITETAKYINEHITYTVMYDSCFTQKASDTIISGKGDCVSMSKVGAAILSGMNIPVKIVEGCVFNPDGRSAVRPFNIPENPFVKLPEDGRGYGPHRGQLHSWLRAYDGVRWITIETTAGVAFSTQFETDYGYDTYGFVNPADGEELCLLNDMDYVNWCLSY